MGDRSAAKTQAFSFQLSAISYQLSAFSCQLFEYCPPAIDLARTRRRPAQNLRGPQRNQELVVQSDWK
jgi:hypothetical protein